MKKQPAHAGVLATLRTAVPAELKKVENEFTR